MRVFALAISSPLSTIVVQTRTSKSRFQKARITSSNCPSEIGKSGYGLGCVFNSNYNNWETSWSVVNLTLSDTQNVLQEKELEVRAERNEKLVHCDWTQLSDTSANSVLWANYRQQLRDIPLQEGFPWDVNWPDSPQ